MLRYTNHSGCDGDPIPPVRPGVRGVILMVERGGCHFTQKVLSAQRAGAMAVLVRDYTDICGEGECRYMVDCSDRPKFGGPGTCPQRMPFLSDDGSGEAVVVPSFMVTRHAGGVLRDCLDGRHEKCRTADPTVSVSLKWNMPVRRADGKVQVTRACGGTVGVGVGVGGVE